MSSYELWSKLLKGLSVMSLLFGLTWPGVVEAVVSVPATSPVDEISSGPPPQENSLDKIEPALLLNLSATSQVEFFVWLTEKTDLSPAYKLQTKAEKGRFVFETLRSTAERSQKALRQDLERQGVRYRPFYIANKILVQGGSQNTVLGLATRSDVARITANHTFQLDEPTLNRSALPRVLSLEPNLSFVKADAVWALGHTGSGVVLAGNDTGLDWDHPALVNQYRGWNGATVDHNYNWWDATGTYPTVPDDGHGHGTHTSGTMVGDGGGANQIGMAPGAQTIHCKNMDDYGSGSEATFTECFEWDLAPWDLNRQNPRPDLAPDAINNSWGYYNGNYPAFEDEIAALQAAGIVVEVSAGNSGPGCASLGSPGDYHQVLTTGSVSHAGGSLPGALTAFSSRGASDLYPDEFIPDVMAPGENIRSSVPGGGYQGGWSGTSMAGPHVTGLIGLLWSANPGLRGLVPETVQIILNTAVPLTGQSGSNCGGDYTTGPNNDWGYGAIDALAAVQQALSFGHVGTLAGTIADATSLTPIGQATVQATQSPTLTWQTTSNASGAYTSTVLSGTYTVAVSKYGYLPAQVTNVAVMSGTTTTLNINMEPANSYTVSGIVTDAATGWPLSARIEIENYPGQPLQNDPVSGEYSITLAAGTGYTFHIEADVDGYTPLSRSLGPLTGYQIENFDLTADLVACTAPGYTPTYQFFDNFETGLDQWAVTGLWNQEADSDTCGAQVNPFPSPTLAAYYGLDNTCTYADSSSLEGSLTMTAPVSLPISGMAGLSFSSYEQTECGGDCPWDNRMIELSTDGGNTWTMLGEGDTEGRWYRPNFDLTPYLGQQVIARFRFNSDDALFNDYLGWLVDDVGIYTGCVPLSGGQTYGYVYDANTSFPLAGAEITLDDGTGTTTAADGFYKLFSPPGAHTLTASKTGGYGTQVQTITVRQDDSIRQDFQLAAGLFSEFPTSLNATLQFGERQTVSFPLANAGGLAADFVLQEQAVSVTPSEQVSQRKVNLVSSSPDPFGYRDTDSNQTGGPDYGWLEIAPPIGGNGTEDVQWLSVAPDAGTLAPNSTRMITLTLDAGAPEITQPGNYTARVRVEEETPYEVTPLRVTMTVTPTGVALAPAGVSKSGQLGSSVGYTLRLTNTLNFSDTYTLSVSGNNWPVATPLTDSSTLARLIIGPLAFGQSETLELLVMVPADAASGATDTATLTVTSQSYPALSATASLTTTANTGVVRPGNTSTVFLPFIVKDER